MDLDLIVTGLGILGIIMLGFDVLFEVLNKLKRDHKLFTTIYVIANFLLFFYSFYFKIWLFVVLNGVLLAIGIYSYYVTHFGKESTGDKT